MTKIKSFEIFKLNEISLSTLENTEKILFNHRFNFIHGKDNSVGKSTLLEGINFCLGSNARSHKSGDIEPQLFCCRAQLENLFLCLTLDHGDEKQSIVLRNTTQYNTTIYIHLSSYLYENYKLQHNFRDVELPGLTEYKSISNTEYKKILEKEFFDCPSHFEFKFRSLIEYSLRVPGHPWAAFYKNSRDKLAIQILYLLSFSDLNWAITYNDNDYKKIKKAVNAMVLSSLGLEEDNFDSALSTLNEKISQITSKLGDAELHLESIKIESENESLWDEVYLLKKERSSLYNEKRPLEQELIDLKEQLELTFSWDYSETIKNTLSEAGIVFSSELLPYLESVVAFHNSVLRDRESDINERRVLLQQNISFSWGKINQVTQNIENKERSIKDTVDAKIISDLQATIEADRSELNKLNAHKELLEKLLDEIPKLLEHKEKSKEWIVHNKSDLDRISTEFKEWCSSVYQGDYERKEIKLYSDDELYFDLFSGLGTAEGETSKILFDIWLLKNSPFMNFLVHDTFMFHGIESPHINNLLDTISQNVTKQYIFSLNQNERQLLSEAQNQFIQENTIIELTHDRPLFGIRC